METTIEYTNRRVRVVGDGVATIDIDDLAKGIECNIDGLGVFSLSPDDGEAIADTLFALSEEGTIAHAQGAAKGYSCNQHEKCVVLEHPSIGARHLTVERADAIAELISLAVEMWDAEDVFAKERRGDDD